MLSERSIIPTADKASIGLSSICAVHCLVLPVLVALFPSLMVAGMQDERIHLGLLVLVVPVSAFALIMGCRQHRQLPIVCLGLVGILVLLFSALFGHDWGGEAMEVTGTLLGAGLVACSHVLNFRLCKSSAVCNRA